MPRDPLLPLRALLESGALRIVYVLGVARSNSTLVCRLLGQMLDGAVYEPAVPNSADPTAHFAGTILAAYRDAAASRSLPVTLAVKDLSLFVEPATAALIAAHAAHVVVTIREPVAAHRSLFTQFRQEFGPLQRLDAIVWHPFEAWWMFTGFLTMAPRLHSIARGALPGQRMGPAAAALAGWTLESWRRLDTQLAVIDPARLTVLDAAQSRRAPDAATAVLAGIARRLMPEGRAPFIEREAHSRMASRSKWAAEARHSSAIAPPPAGQATQAPTALEQAIAERTGLTYRALLDSQANPLKR
jgi:hypothetical protein